ncbi:MAG: hypothetical protein HFI09_02780 [Bacilli bacterium]|nr:hypothetical protein [Bacilli bacterium]
MARKRYISSLYKGKNKITIWKTNDKYHLENGEQSLTMSHQKKGSFSNTLLTGLIIGNLLSPQEESLFHENINIQDTQNDNLDNVILNYELENQSSYIKEHQSNFWQYYNALKNNKDLTDFDCKAALKSFSDVHKYLGYDFENQLKKLEQRCVITNDQLCDEENVDGLFFKNGHNIYVRTDKEEIVCVHENIHHHWDFPNVLYLLNQQPTDEPSPFTDTIYGSSIEEALASDLSCIESSLSGFPTTYLKLNFCLQSLYATFGRDTTLKMLSKPNYLLTLYQEFLKIGCSEEEILNFFDRLNILHALTLHQNKEKIDTEELLLDLSYDLIMIYENKTKQSWEKSLKMQTIIYALNQDSSFSRNVKTTTKTAEYYKQIKSLVTQKTFLKGIDLTKGQLSVVIDSTNQNWYGNICIQIQKGIIEPGSKDIFVYAYENDTLVRENSFNSQTLKQIEKLKKYNISKSYWPFYLANFIPFQIVEKQISNYYALNEREKEYMMSLFPQLCHNHSSFMSPDYIDAFQLLFIEALENCHNFFEVNQLFLNKETIYQKGIKNDIKRQKIIRLNDFSHHNI